MTEELQTNTQSSETSRITLNNQVLKFYRRVLDAIVTALVFIMVLILIGAVVGLILDFMEAANKFGSAVTSHSIAHGIVDSIDRELVIDVLSVFVLIELFRTFTDYLEFRRVRLRVLSEVGIAFVLREVFIGLYDHSMNWTEIITLSVLLAVLVAARTAAVQFHPQDSGSE